MAKPVVSDELWAVVQPLLPKRRLKRDKGGRPPVPDRAAFTGILFVLKTGIPWEDLPQEMGCGSGMSCWRRLRDWHRAGVFKRLHRQLLGRMRKAGRLDFSRGLVDSASVRALHGGKKREKAPWIAGKRVPSTT
jgi:transposase